jgi:hypothetical protein
VKANFSARRAVSQFGHRTSRKRTAEKELNQSTVLNVTPAAVLPETSCRGHRYTSPAGGCRVVKLSSHHACLYPSGKNANDGGDEHGGDEAYREWMAHGSPPFSVSTTRDALQKSETPARYRGRFQLNTQWNLVAMGRVPGNAGNVGPADADVGKLTVAQARQFVQALVIALPFLDEADKCGKHGIVLSFSKFRPSRPVVSTET